MGAWQEKTGIVANYYLIDALPNCDLRPDPDTEECWVWAAHDAGPRGSQLLVWRTCGSGWRLCCCASGRLASGRFLARLACPRAPDGDSALPPAAPAPADSCAGFRKVPVTPAAAARHEHRRPLD